MWLDLQKPSRFTQELKSNLKSDINDAPMYCLKNINYMAIDIQGCFHRQLFANPVKLHWCITGPVQPLGSTNQSSWGTRLLPMSVSTYPVDYVHLCHLLSTQHNCLCPNGKENPPSVCPPTPTTIPTLLSPPTPIHTHDITRVVKAILKTSSKYWAA